MKECNRIIGERIAEFRMQGELPIRFRVDLSKTIAPQRACGIQVVPADAREKAKLTLLRDRLAVEIFRYHAEDHATFGFHISLAYQMSPFSDEERRRYQRMLELHISKIIAAAPVIELGDPEFCTFNDMYRFDVQTLLRT